MPFQTDKTEEVPEYSLQMEEDIRLFKIGIVLQRLGWILMLAVLVAGGFGFFGTGYFSVRRQQAPGIHIAYEHFMRFDNQTELVIRLDRSADTTVVSLPLSYLDHFIVDKTMPDPSSTRAAGGMMHYCFLSGRNTEVRLFISPVKAGPVAGNVYIDGKPFRLSHFVYP